MEIDARKLIRWGAKVMFLYDLLQRRYFLLADMLQLFMKTEGAFELLSFKDRNTLLEMARKLDKLNEEGRAYVENRANKNTD